VREVQAESIFNACTTFVCGNVLTLNRKDHFYELQVRDIHIEGKFKEFVMSN
jgi:hypothetical protein